MAIECQRTGIEVIAVDRYPDAPAMHVAHRSHVINMLDGEALRHVITEETALYRAGNRSDRHRYAARAGGRRAECRALRPCNAAHDEPRRDPSPAAEELGLPTSTYRFADSEASFHDAVAAVGFPCIVKPVMSSSGKGQSFIRSAEQLAQAWEYAQQGGRAGAGRVIVEGVVKFDFEITLLTVSAVDGVHFCAPVGHRQQDGDYRESRQPQQMSELALKRAQRLLVMWYWR